MIISVPLNPQDISIRKYKIILWKAVKDTLEIAGYEIAALEEELICTSMTTMQSPPRRGRVTLICSKEVT